jgi:hypothetical protein
VLTPTATMVLGLSPTMPTVVILLVLIGACLVCPEVLTGLLAGRREGRDAGPGGGHVGAPQRVGFRPRRRRARTASSWRLILLILVGLGLALVAATLLESFVPGSGARLTLLLGAAIPYTTVLVTGLLLLRLRQVVGGSRL